MRYAMVAAVMTWLTCGQAASQTDEEIKWAVGEVGGELQQCSVYFLVLSSCVAKQEPALSHKYSEMADKTAELAITASRMAGVSNEAYIAMGSIEVEDMMNSMNRNCTNIAVLLKKYTKFCQRLTSSTDVRISEWANCIRTKKKTCGGP